LLSLILVVVIVVAAVIGVIAINPKNPLLWLIPVVLLVVLTLTDTVVVIPAGNVGVVTRFGAVTGTNFEQGLHMKIPFAEAANVFDVRTQKDQVDAAAASKDLQEVKSTVAVNYHLDAKKASTVFAEVGTKYKERVIDPAVQESFKFTTAQFTAEELITQREAVKTKARDFLTARLSKFHIIVDEFNIVNFDFSADFNRAIEAKQVAQQNVEKAKRDLERIKVEAEQKIAEAEGSSRAQQLQQQTLTELYVQFKALEKWDGKLPTVMGGAVPFINLPTGK
jgi:regulator of protease activity HflC (stomatin/prohibitin superfamily)